MEGIQERPISKNISVGVEAIVGWLGARTSSCCGVKISQEETHKLSQIIQSRMTALSVNEPIRYFQLVESQSAEGVTEWDQLLARFMNGETFFFRDSGQFTLLKEQILPTLIQDRQTVRTLRIWSAGCSTGEEAYSLAILVDQLLPDHRDWDISILATDINVQSIQHAQQGMYGQWAFRKVDTEMLQRYFTQTGSQWVLNESIRKMVTFRQCNLVADTFPSATLGINDLDLILCRNVFLYFHTEAIGQVMKKMAESLVSDGFVLTGHGELPAQTGGALQAKIYPDSVIYQRPQGACAGSSGSSR